MRSRSCFRRARRTGFTLVELVLATGILLVIGYVLADAVGMGRNSQRSVMRLVSENQAIRTAAVTLTNELRAADAATLSISTLPDGNHEITYMQPIEVAGAPAWGVYDPSYGPDPESCNKPDWKVRYTVQNVPGEGGALVRGLVRAILDETGLVQEQDIVVVGLESGTATPPGFTMIQSGDVWEITISTVGRTTNGKGRGAVFHVKNRS